MSQSTDYRTSHVDKGGSYDTMFSHGSYAHMLWRHEQAILSGVLRRHFAEAPVRHLDVACGTGRVTGHLSQLTRLSCGLDISESMLGEARRKYQTTPFVRADFADNTVPFRELFDVVTAFRFFLNAEPDLRMRVARNVAHVLAPRGIFIFNNHRNYNSLTYRALRALGRSPDTLKCMKQHEVDEFLECAGLTIAQRYHVGLLPGTDKRSYVPVAVAYPAEVVVRSLPGLARLCNDIIYVCVAKA